MSKYQEKQVSGESWVRAKRIVIENQLGEAPRAKFVEEKILVSDGEYFQKDLGILDIDPDNKHFVESDINLLDETGSPTGQTISYRELNGILTSAYIHYAHLRDNPPEPEHVEEELYEDGYMDEG